MHLLETRAPGGQVVKCTSNKESALPVRFLSAKEVLVPWMTWKPARQGRDVGRSIFPPFILAVLACVNDGTANDSFRIQFLGYGAVRTALAKLDEEYRERFRSTRPDISSSERVRLVNDLNHALYNIMLPAVILDPQRLSTDDVACVAEIADRLRIWGIANEYAQMAVERNRGSIGSHFIRIRSLLNMKQLDAALSAADEANSWCPNCRTLYILHYHLYRSCRAQRHEDCFEQITLLLDRCNEQAVSDPDAVKVMSNSLEQFREEYEQANALPAMRDVLDGYRDRARQLVQLQKENKSKDRKVFLHTCELRRLVCRIDRVLEDGRKGCEDLAEWCGEIAEEVSRDGFTGDAAYGYLMALKVYQESQDLFGECRGVREAVSVIRDGAMTKLAENRLAAEVFRLCSEIDTAEKIQPVVDGEPTMP